MRTAGRMDKRGIADTIRCLHLDIAFRDRKLRRRRGASRNTKTGCDRHRHELGPRRLAGRFVIGSVVLLVVCHGFLLHGRWSLVIGHWSLVVGRWSLVVGRWSLVIGRWSEDHEVPRNSGAMDE